ncbi:hypothetical protein [Sphingomonas sp.]|uniref:hypothetical protein n=1 Tax=Sphingomonas sp. TaxID=28214 RepID=UPI0035C87235
MAIIAAASSLIISTTAATAQTRVEPTRAASTRAATPAQRNAQIAGAPVWLVALLAALAVAGLIAAATSGGDNDQSPESP